MYIREEGIRIALRSNKELYLGSAIDGSGTRRSSYFVADDYYDALRLVKAGWPMKWGFTNHVADEVDIF